MHLKREPNVGDFDALYAAVIEAHSDLSESESAALNARLVLFSERIIGESPSWPLSAHRMARRANHR